MASYSFNDNPVKCECHKLSVTSSMSCLFYALPLFYETVLRCDQGEFYISLINDVCSSPDAKVRMDQLILPCVSINFGRGGAEESE